MKTLRFIGKRWKPAVLWKIDKGNLRFKDLKTALPYISDKMLANTVSELEADGIIKKIVYEEIPLRIEYQLTDFGKGMIPLLDAMDQWGSNMLTQIKNKEQKLG